VLKAKRLRASGQLALPQAALSNKRYLILTYQGEFDRVHYPLPLAFDEFPDPQELKRTIAQLRGEEGGGRGDKRTWVLPPPAASSSPSPVSPAAAQLGEGGHAGSPHPPEDLLRALEDNRALRRELTHLQASTSRPAAPDTARDAPTRQLEVERDAALGRAAAAEAALDELRLSSKRELRLRARELTDAEQALQASKAAVRELRAKTRDLAAVRFLGSGVDVEGSGAVRLKQLVTRKRVQIRGHPQHLTFASCLP